MATNKRIKITATDESVCISMIFDGVEQRAFYFGIPGTLTGADLQEILEALEVDELETEYTYTDLDFLEKTNESV